MCVGVIMGEQWNGCECSQVGKVGRCLVGKDEVSKD